MERTFTIDGRPRSVSVAEPVPELERSGVAVSVLHGSQQTGVKVRAASGRSFEQKAGDGWPVVAYPDAYRGLWNDARTAMRSPARAEGIDDVAFLTSVSERLRSDGAERVIAVGYSNGGHMALRLAHEAPDALDGLVLIGVGHPTADNFTAVDRYSPLPVITIHGTKDPLAPYEGGVTSLFGFRPRGKGLSAPDTAAYYARRNGITGQPLTRRLPSRANSARTWVDVTSYQQENRPPVTLYTVHGGGHVIPNPTRRGWRILGRTTRDIDAGALVARMATLLGGNASGPRPPFP
ncbi:hypothetical protein [Streptomyces sp. NPDC048636]|uniref:alpha/beta hydrolase family esterase n=1 Tax=Streptomyces sp. NPDC048636 TaxID=3155762 RepID=UPI003435B906